MPDVRDQAAVDKGVGEGTAVGTRGSVTPTTTRRTLLIPRFDANRAATVGTERAIGQG